MKHTTNASLYSSSALYSRHTRLIATLAFSVVGFTSATNVYANPTGSSVTSGSVSVSGTGTNQVVVTQTTDRAVINWQSFDILNGETTRFIQPSSGSVALNRISSGSPTQILGTLTANGQLMIVNSSGVFFGKNAQVNVAGLVVSTADIADANFNAGKYKFDRAGKADASIVNKGTITAAEGGLVALLAPGVSNDGVITAKAGSVALGAGETFAVDFYGDNLYSFEVATKATAKAKDETGNDLGAAITNTGHVNAGVVYMTANAAKDVVNQAINTTGIIDATSAHMDGGTIVLDGGEGNVNVGGKLKASGKKGGNVTVATTGDITLASATIDASGTTGGGNVKIGGDSQGGGTLAHAANTSIDANSVIDASATDTGNGGSVVVWSDNNTETHGTISARGGVNGGNGGSIETSGANVNFDGSVIDASATSGDNGSWLIDPLNITINALGAFAIDFALDTGNDVMIDTTSKFFKQAGNITINSDIEKTGGTSASLTFKADNDIILNNQIKSTSNKLNVTLDADKDNSGAGAISLNSGSSIISNGGNITLGGGANALTGAAHGDASAPHTPYGGEAGINVNNALVDAGAGNIVANGVGGNNGQNVGVEITGSGEFKTTSGNITVNGTGGNTASYGSYGVVLGDGGTITTATGAINITGKGGVTGAGLGYGNGVQLYNSSSITSTGTGSITLNGTAGGPSSGGNYGVYTVDGSNTIGGASDKGTITINSDSVNLSGTTVNTAAKVAVTTTGDVALAGSTVTAGTDLDINNSGVFSSDTASVLLGATVELNQNLPGSIQNAINAVNKLSGSTTLTLSAGVWDQVAQIIGYNNFTMQGTGNNDTHIQPGAVFVDGAPSIQNAPIWDSQSYKPMLLAENGNNINFTNLNVDGFFAGSSPFAGIVYNNAGGTVSHVSVTQGGSFGIFAVDTSATAGATAHTVTVDSSSIAGNGWSDIAAIGDLLTMNVTNSDLNGHVTEAMDFSNHATGSFTDNTITNASSVGISLHGSHDVSISGGSITGTGTGTTGISDDGLAYGVLAANNVSIDGVTITNVGNGIVANGGSNWSVTGNTITTGVGSTGISATGADDMTISGNTISGGTTGINVSGLTDVGTHGNSIYGNSVDGTSADAIDASGSVNLSIAKNLIGQTTKITGMGINVSDLSDGSSITGNTLDNIGSVGINASGDTNLAINGNFIGTKAGHIARRAISVDGDNDVSIDGNTVGNGSAGVFVTNLNDNGGNGNYVIGNTIDGTYAEAIYANGDVNLDISKNLVGQHSTMSGYGIYVTGLTGGSSITGNTVDNVGRDGINSSHDTNLAINGNFIGTHAGHIGGSGILVFGENDINVDGNHIASSVTGINAAYVNDLGGNGSTINGNTIDGTSGDAIDATKSTNLSIGGNVIGQTTKIKGLGINVSSLKADKAGNSSITGNTLDNIGDVGINASGDTDLAINGNFVGTHAGHITRRAISVDGDDDVSIDGNTLAHATAGVFVTNLTDTGGNGNYILGNTINSMSSEGVYANGAVNLDIGGNLIGQTANVGTYGIYATGLSADASGNSAITGNTVDNVNADGINASASSDLAINGNFIGTHAGHVPNRGISVSSGDDITIDFNTVNGVGNRSIFASNLTDNGGNGNSIYKNTVTGGTYGISVDSVVNTDISTNTVNSATTAIAVSDLNEHHLNNNITIEHNKINTATTGISVYDANNVTIDRNTLSGIATDGIVVASGTEEEDATRNSHITIDGNKITAADKLASGTGISVSGSDHVTIGENGRHNGNRIYDFVTGISTDDDTDVSIAHNTIQGSGTGLSISDEHGVNFSGNTIYARTTAIDVEDSRNITLDNNHLFNTGDSTGINIADSHSVDADGNDIHGFTTGISVSGGSDNTLDGNLINAVDRHGHLIGNVSVGIDVEGSTQDHITNNRIIAGAEGGDTGIKLDGVTHSNVGSTGRSNDGNTISGFDTGIGVYGLVAISNIVGSKPHYSTHDITINGNTITGFVPGGAGTHPLFVDSNGIDLGTVSNVIVGDNGRNHGNTISGYQTGVNVANSTIIDIGHNNISNVDTGISVDPSSHIAITDNYLHTIFADGIDVSDSDNVTVSGNSIYAASTNFDSTGIKLTDVTNSTIGGNQKAGNDIYGFDIGIGAYGTATTNDDNVTTYSTHDINIIGNSIYGIVAGGEGPVSTAGVDLGTVGSVNVGYGANHDGLRSGTYGPNTISNFQTGVNVSDSLGVLVGNNTIETVNTGISVDSSQTVQLVNNSITSVFDDGIDVTGANNVTITGNGIYAASSNTDGTGIYLSGVSNSTVGGGEGFGNTISGFDTGIGVYGLIAKNNIFGSTPHYSTHDIAIDGNTITGVAAGGEGSTFPSSSTGIDLGVVTNVSIGDNDRNFISNYKTGVNVANSTLVDINNNEISSVNTGINIDSSNNMNITNNYIHNVFGDGMDIANADSITITNNNLVSAGGEGNSATGIALTNVTNSVVGGGEGLGNTITGFGTGVSVSGSTIAQDDGSVTYTSHDITIDGNTIGGGEGFFGPAGNTGVSIDTAQNITVGESTLGNSITSFGTGVNVVDGLSINIGSNTITNVDTGVSVDPSQTVHITDNQISQVWGDGIDVSSTDDLTITNNGIFSEFGGGTGIYLDGVTNASIGGTTGLGNDIEGFGTGIGVYGLVATNVEGTHYSTHDITINGNTIVGGGEGGSAGVIGVDLGTVSHVTVGDSATGDANGISNFTTGVKVANSSVINVGSNTVSYTSTGIALSNSSDISVNGNTITGGGEGATTALSLSGITTGTDTVGSNIISNSAIGISVDGSSGVQFASNTVTGTGSSIGVKVSDSSGISFSGDSFLSNLFGVELDGAQNTTLSGVTLTDNDTGLYALNGSSGTLVGNTQFNGGTTGVLLDGEGTDMQFSDGLSSFTGQTNYFVLQNHAMFGEILDASHQTFDGVLASLFTQSQYVAAENKTTDILDGDVNLGLVFYRNFNGFDINLLNQFLQNNNKQGVGGATFSYSGQTIAGIITNTAYNFTVPSVNLSLLSPSAGTPPVAGSTTNLGNLSPSAGGNASDFAALNPAAGGGSNGESCGNSFLGDGLSAGTCQAQ